MKLAGYAAIACALIAAAPVRGPAAVLGQLGPADRAALQAAVEAVFPENLDFTVRPAHIGWADVDRRVHVDFPASRAPEGRVARHASITCEVPRDSAQWRCGEDRRMLWEVRPSPDWSAACSGPVRGLSASTIASYAEIVELVDLFCGAEDVRDLLEGQPSCQGQRFDFDPFQMSGLSARGSSAMTAHSDYTAIFFRHRSSNAWVRVDRECPWFGSCALEVVGCSVLITD